MTDADNVARNDMTDRLEDEHAPPGENQGVRASFSVEAVARAFQVDHERALRAFAGEFGLDSEGVIDSRQAQHLADLLLADRTQDEREAALMELGAYTPRRDTIAPSVSEKAPGEIEDSRLAPDSRRRADVLQENDE